MKLEAHVSGLYIGKERGLEKESVQSLVVDLEGIEGDKHRGFIRQADSRNPKYPRGTLMRNDRQWSLVSPEELKVIAEIMGVPHIDPGWIGANLALMGIRNLTQLPKGTVLRFPQDAVLLVESENNPCTGPGEVIASKYPNLDLQNGRKFPKAAYGRRGLVGVVERAGSISLKDVVTVEVYEPKLYSLPPRLK